MRVFKRAGSPYYWADFTTASGERIRKSTRCRDKRAAENLLREWSRAAEHATADAVAGIERGTDISMIDLAAEYLAWMETSDRAQSTVDAAKRHIKTYILPWFGEDAIARDVTERDVRAFVDDVAAARIVPVSSQARAARRRKDGRPAPGTVNRILSNLRRVFAFGEQRKHIPRNPAKAVEALKERNADRHRALTDAEIAAWLKAMTVGVPKARRGDYAHAARWVRFALATGLRKGEMQTVQWSDLDEERGVLRVRAEEAKGRETRRLPLTSAALEVIREIKALDELDEDAKRVGAIFGPGDPKRALGSAWSRIKPRLPGRAPTAHDLRHTCASRAAAAGAGLAELMSWFGWKDPQTAARYLHAYDDRLAGLARRMDGGAAS